MPVYYQPGYKPGKCGKHDSDCHSPIDCKPQYILARCNNLTGVSGLGVVAVGEVVTPRTLGNLSLSGLHCFKRPVVKLDLTAVITVSADLALDTTITFRIFKRCGNGEETEIQSFDVNPGIALAAGASIPVAFSICDHNECYEKHCVYRVTVEATAAVALAAAINVNQGALSALVYDLC